MKQECISVTQEKELSATCKNLFLVSTALHLFNAIEAQHHFNTSNNILVLLFYGNQDEIQIMKFLQYFPYDKLITFSPGNEKRYHKLNLSLIKEINTYTYDKVFMGYFSANLRRFTCNFSYKELFLFDDGTYLIALHNELYASNQPSKLIRKYSEKPRKTKLKHIKFMTYDFYRKFYFRLHGYRNDYKKMELHFFTIFKLKQYKNEKIINHSFQHLQRIFKQKKLSSKSIQKNEQKTVYFLGQPLTKAFDISATEYLHYMMQIKSFYKQTEYKIIYIPHRSEEAIPLELIHTLADNTFQILRLDVPFESYLLQENTDATHIASFFSSALFTTKKLFPAIQVEAFKPLFDLSKRNDIEAIYNIIKKDNIKIHPLKGTQ